MLNGTRSIPGDSDLMCNYTIVDTVLNATRTVTNVPPVCGFNTNDVKYCPVYAGDLPNLYYLGEDILS